MKHSFLHSTTKTNKSLCLFVCLKTHFHLPNGAQQLRMRFLSFRNFAYSYFENGLFLTGFYWFGFF